MSIPVWILDIFAAVMLLVAAVSAGQLVVARAWTRQRRGRRRHRRLPPADGYRHGGDAGRRPQYPPERRLGGDLRRHDGLVRLEPVAGDTGPGRRRSGPRPSCAAPRAQRGDVLCVRRPRGAGVQRRLRHGRDGGWLVQRHADPEVAHAGARLRAGPGRLHRPRPGPAGLRGRLLPRRAPPLRARRSRRWPPRARAARADLPGRCGPSRPGAAAPPWRTWRGTGPLRWRRPQPPSAGSSPGGQCPGGTVPGQTVPGPTAAGPTPAQERLLLAPGVVKACRVAMGVTMAFMLIIMI